MDDLDWIPDCERSTLLLLELSFQIEIPFEKEREAEEGNLRCPPSALSAGGGRC